MERLERSSSSTPIMEMSEDDLHTTVQQLRDQVASTRYSLREKRQLCTRLSETLSLANVRHAMKSAEGRNKAFLQEMLCKFFLENTPRIPLQRDEAIDDIELDNTFKDSADVGGDKDGLAGLRKEVLVLQKSLVRLARFVLEAQQQVEFVQGICVAKKFSVDTVSNSGSMMVKIIDQHLHEYQDGALSQPPSPGIKDTRQLVDWSQEEECSERLYRAMCLNKVGDKSIDVSQMAKASIQEKDVEVQIPWQRHGIKCEILLGNQPDTV